MAKTETESGVVHFRVGENFGALLMSIAQEHLTERNNPVQALKTITESLHGCPIDLAVEILKGSIVLLVDEDTQQVMPTERTTALDNLFPKVDPLYFMESRTRKIKEYGGYILDGLTALQVNIRQNRGYFTMDFNYEDIFKFVAGDNEALLEELRDNRKIDGIASLFETTKKFIEETMKTQSTMEWMMKTFDDFAVNKNYEYYLQLKGDVTEILADIAFKLNKTLKLQFSMDEPTDTVQAYIDNAREIEEVLQKGIEPVDIMDNWSAGWLSPEGEYYALNGEIANMLHNQIASALYEKGVIPESEENENNPDGWLCKNGWVKIHNNHILFDGWYNEKYSSGQKNVYMTKKQIQAIYEFGQKCGNGVLKLGLEYSPVSAVMFQTLGDNQELMYDKYFKL